MLYDHCRIWRFASLFVVGLLFIVVLAAPFVSAAKTSCSGYEGIIIERAYVGNVDAFYNDNEASFLKQLLIDSYYYDLAIILAIGETRLYGSFWSEDGEFRHGLWENPYSQINASYVRLYSMADLELLDSYGTGAYFSRELAERSTDFVTKSCAYVDWDNFQNGDRILTISKTSYNATWTETSYVDWLTIQAGSAYGYIYYPVSWKTVDFVVDYIEPTDPTEPVEPSEPGGSTLPTNPGLDPERPFASTQPIWIRKLDSFAFPDFPLGGDPLTLNVEASSPNGGQILYQWHITGQNVDGTIFLNQTSSWGTNSSFDISLEREGLYSVIAYAKNRYNDDSGASVDSLFISTSLRYIVSADGTDSLPDSVVPPYDGWAEDSIIADGYKNQVSDRVDSIQEGLGIIDSVTVPNIDNIDINILDMIEGDGFNAMNTILSTFWENNIIITVLTFAFVFAMIGYFIFGKR